VVLASSAVLRNLRFLMCSEIAVRFPTVVQTAAGRAKLSRAHGGEAAVNAPFSPTRPGQPTWAGLKGAGRATASPSRHDEVGGADLALAERDDVSTATSDASEERGSRERGSLVIRRPQKSPISGDSESRPERERSSLRQSALRADDDEPPGAFLLN